jgi:hypothetical protein
MNPIMQQVILHFWTSGMMPIENEEKKKKRVFVNDKLLVFTITTRE